MNSSGKRRKQRFGNIAAGFLQVLLILITDVFKGLKDDRHGVIGKKCFVQEIRQLKKGDISLVFLSSANGNLRAFVRPSAT